MPFVSRKQRPAFSLVEVVLAVGVLALAIVALVALFGPTVTAVRDVIDTDESANLEARFRALVSSPDPTPDDAELEGLTLNQIVTAVTSNTPAEDSLVVMWTSRPLGSDGTFGRTKLEHWLGLEGFNRALDDLEAGDLEGGIYAALIQPVSDTSFNYGAVSSGAYVPFDVTLFTLDPDALRTLFDSGGTFEIVYTEEGEIDYESSSVSQADRLIEYTTAASRR
ncbi:MAG: hypothetical protein ACFB21_04655 [Opitutales bacterium]